MPDNRKELMCYRLNTDYSDFFIVSLQDANEQYEKAKEFLEAIENYLK